MKYLRVTDSDALKFEFNPMKGVKDTVNAWLVIDFFSRNRKFTHNGDNCALEQYYYLVFNKNWYQWFPPVMALSGETNRNYLYCPVVTKKSANPSGKLTYSMLRCGQINLTRGLVEFSVTNGQ